MSPPLELDCIALADVSSTNKLAGGVRENLRETELRLGLPGSESPDRKGKVGLALGLQLAKGFASGAKRGFSDAIDGNGMWVLSGSSGSEAEMEKGATLFSPRAGGGAGQFAAAGKITAAQEKKAQGPPAAK